MRDTPLTTDPEERRAIARIEQALSSLGSEYSPPPGWEAKVLTAADAEERRRKPVTPEWQRWLRWGLPATGVLATAVVMLMFWPQKQVQPVASTENLALVMVTTGSAVKVRGDGCTIGQPHSLSFDSSAAHRELRIYRDDKLVFQCGTASPGQACDVSRDKISAVWTPELGGSYEWVTAASSQVLPVVKESLDRDMTNLNEKPIRSLRRTFFCS